MPSRNIPRIDIPASYYHVYARGRNRQVVFNEPEDYTMFISLFKRYLSVRPEIDGTNRQYMHLHGAIDLVCYCLMPNHFHLQLYQRDSGAMAKLLRGLLVSYTHYYNKKYGKSGPLFESTYKASRISTDEYLLHISRYIHLNPRDWDMYDYSSYEYFRDGNYPEWLAPHHAVDLFRSKDSYMCFVKDYEENKLMLDEIKHELANY